MLRRLERMTRQLPVAHENISSSLHAFRERACSGRETAKRTHGSLDRTVAGREQLFNPSRKLLQILNNPFVM